MLLCCGYAGIRRNIGAENVTSINHSAKRKPPGKNASLRFTSRLVLFLSNRSHQRFETLCNRTACQSVTQFVRRVCLVSHWIVRAHSVFPPVLALNLSPRYLHSLSLSWELALITYTPPHAPEPSPPGPLYYILSGAPLLPTFTPSGRRQHFTYSQQSGNKRFSTLFLLLALPSGTMRNGIRVVRISFKIASWISLTGRIPVSGESRTARSKIYERCGTWRHGK